MMYLPPQFDVKDRVVALTLMQENPFASLISTDEEGHPFVSHLPFHLESVASCDGIAPFKDLLLGHVAKGNPHWKYLQARPQALVTFMGAHAYLSPSVYPDLARVPTWNYVAVHCTVNATLIDDLQGKDQLLKKLIADHEPAYAKQWQGLDQAFAHKMLGGIVAFELEITDIQCKIKINQHRPESHEAMRTLYAAGGENEQNLALWMDRLGMAVKSKT